MLTNHNIYQNNIYFMGLALQQAKKILGNTKKNPAVGCIIVKNEVETHENKINSFYQFSIVLCLFSK